MAGSLYRFPHGASCRDSSRSEAKSRDQRVDGQNYAKVNASDITAVSLSPPRQVLQLMPQAPSVLSQASRLANKMA